ncbi:MAG: hypothetical protein Q8R94_18635, partial [Phenylobacterium sp.]|nr:hypothetical protein [Phenylobacterium sp.]
MKPFTALVLAGSRGEPDPLSAYAGVSHKGLIELGGETLLAAEAAVRSAAPDTIRSFMKFRDGRYSGCNLFYLRGDAALAVIDLWRQVEAHRKQPWKIAALLGPGML